MPIAVLKEVTRSWVLGPIICDIWVMIDLLCCTASILHLVAIALDRYWAITNCKWTSNDFNSNPFFFQSKFQLIMQQNVRLVEFLFLSVLYG